MKFLGFAVAFFLTISAYAQDAAAWITAIQQAHQTEKFKNFDAIQFDLELYFGGKLRLNGTITATTNSSKVKVVRKDGASLTFDNGEVWKVPATAEWPGARFDALTWQYFFFAPHKFNDPGTNWELTGEAPLADDTYETARLTFDSGTGDAPDDWYLAYADSKKHRLNTLAYIVTFGGRDAAKAEPHAIVYDDYKKIKGVPIAHDWTFRMWTAEKGTGEEIGKASITNVRFLRASEADFSLNSEEAVAVPLGK